MFETTQPHQTHIGYTFQQCVVQNATTHHTPIDGFCPLIGSIIGSIIGSFFWAIAHRVDHRVDHRVVFLGDRSSGHRVIGSNSGRSLVWAETVLSDRSKQKHS